MQKHRETSKLKLSKWNEFRQRKKVIIDNYCKVKRRKMALEWILGQLFLKEMLKICFGKVKVARDYRNYMTKLMFLQIKFYCVFKMYLNKH